MTKSEKKHEVDEFISKSKKWKAEYENLREIVLDCNLTEDFKWMHPCYTLNGKNVVLIHGFKDYCALLFHKGALLQDQHKLLVQQTENVQAARQLRFSHVDDIIEKENIIKEYINEAIETEEAGLKVELKKTEEYPIPEELQLKFDEVPELKPAFEELTPGRQRAYILYFSQAKKRETRVSRVEKYTEKILKGKGMNDK